MKVLIRVLTTAAALFVATAAVPGIELPFHITGFWPAFWGAIIVGVVGWVLGITLGENRRRPREPQG